MKKQKLGYLITLMVIIFINFGFPQELTSNILLGQSMSIDSKYLNETREVFIHLPDDYMTTNNNYPVMYVMDGGAHFFTSSALSHFYARNRQIPNMIIVAIPNTNRNRDFTPIQNNQNPEWGGAENFISFLNKELMPAIEKNYRTHDYKILFGHSLTGMFSIYTLFNYTEMFDAIIAASPYLMYDELFQELHWSFK